MKRCFYLTCEGEKQGYLLSRSDGFCEVLTLDNKKLILHHWKVLEVSF